MQANMGWSPFSFINEYLWIFVSEISETCYIWADFFLDAYSATAVMLDDVENV